MGPRDEAKEVLAITAQQLLVLVTRVGCLEKQLL
jgi:hypothetical protein